MKPLRLTGGLINRLIMRPIGWIAALVMSVTPFSLKAQDKTQR